MSFEYHESLLEFTLQLGLGSDLMYIQGQEIAGKFINDKTLMNIVYLRPNV